MSALNTTLGLNDGMSGTLKTIYNAMRPVMGMLEQTQQVMNSTPDLSFLDGLNDGFSDAVTGAEALINQTESVRQALNNLPNELAVEAMQLGAIEAKDVDVGVNVDMYQMNRMSETLERYSSGIDLEVHAENHAALTLKSEMEAVADMARNFDETLSVSGQINNFREIEMAVQKVDSMVADETTLKLLAEVDGFEEVRSQLSNFENYASEIYSQVVVDAQALEVAQQQLGEMNDIYTKLDIDMSQLPILSQELNSMANNVELNIKAERSALSLVNDDINEITKMISGFDKTLNVQAQIENMSYLEDRLAEVDGQLRQENLLNIVANLDGLDAVKSQVDTLRDYANEIQSKLKVETSQIGEVRQQMNQIKEIHAKINIDTSQFNQVQIDAQNQTIQLKSMMEDLAQSISNAKDPSDTIRLLSEYQGLNSELMSLIAGQEEFNQAMASADISQKVVAYDNLNSQISETARLIQNNENQQQRFTQEIQNSKRQWSLMSTLVTTLSIGRLVGMARDFFRATKDIADTYILKNAQIAQMNDGLQTNEELQRMIMNSATRVRAEFELMAGTITKLNATVGDMFANNASVIQFAETIKQTASISATGAHGIEMSFRAIDRAMAEGSMSARDFDLMKRYNVRAIEAMADYLGVSVMEMRNLATQGQLTADVIASSMLGSVDIINEQFGEIPKTFADMMIGLRNTSLQAFSPLMNAWSDFINSSTFQAGLQIWERGIHLVASALTVLFNIFAQVAEFVYQNSTVIERVLWAIAIMIGIVLVGKLYDFAAAAVKNFFVAGAAGQQAGYQVALAWMKANWPLLLMGAIIAGLVIFWDQMGQVARAVLMGIAVALLIVKLAAMKVTWPFLLIIAIIAIVALGFIFFRDVAIEVMGAIVGAAFWMGQLMINVGKGIANLFIAVWEWIVNAFHRMVYWVLLGWYHIQRTAIQMAIAVTNGVQGMVDVVLSGISAMINTAISGLNRLISLANNIPGVNISTVGEVEFATNGNWSSGMQATLDALDRPTLNTAEFDRFEYGSLGDAFSQGQALGQQWGNAIGDGLDWLAGQAAGLVNGGGTGDYGDFDFGMNDIGLNQDFLDSMNGICDALGSGLGPGLGAGNNIGDIGQIRDDVTISDEDLKLMLDVARRDTVIHHSTISPNVSFTLNNYDNDLDEDAIAEKVEDKIMEAIALGPD